MPLPALKVQQPKIVRESHKDWLKGTVTAFDDGRTPADGLRASGNVWLQQDGTVRPRPSLIKYGTVFPGTLLGELFEFTKTLTSSTQNWIIGMFNVSGTTRPYVSKDGGAWQATIGKTYDNAALAHFVEIDEKVVIMNGSDNLSFMDVTTAGTTNTITAFTALSAPTAPVATKTGLGGTTLTYYYRITANSSFGETAETVAATVSVDRQREAWDTTTNFVTVTWTASAGAVSTTTYNVYVGVASGQEFLVASGLNGTTYKDVGSDPQDVTRTAPSFDNTTGPAVSRGTVINGQLFLTGDKNHPRYIWYGGTGQSVLDFSALNGGGYVEIGRGTKDIPVAVRSFRDHSGAPVITVLCQGTNGKGKRYTMTPSSLTIGSNVISFFDVQEDNGQAGTDSPDAVLFYNDSLWYPSRDGFKTTGTKPQLQNVLSTDTVSETILNDVINLNTAYMNKAVGLGYQQQLYFALPNGATSNNEIWILDLQRGGAWMKPWNIAADQMTLYNDNSGMTHFLIVKSNIMYELSYSASTADDGVAFPTNITSGIIKFSDDGQTWAKVIRLTFILLRPQGVINITVTGRTEDAELQSVGTANVTPINTVVGWGETSWGGSPDVTPPNLPVIFGWSDFAAVPTVIGTARYQVDIDIDEELQYYQWSIDTNSIGVDFQLSDVISQRVDIGVKDLS
jgi:hypothetical protein